MRLDICLTAVTIAGWGCDLAKDSTQPVVWTITVTEAGGDGSPIPARLLLLDEDGQSVHFGVRDRYDGRRQVDGYCELGAGAIGTWDAILLPDGTAEIPIGKESCEPLVAIPFANYQLRVWQGIEYERAEVTVDLRESRGKVESIIPLERVFDPWSMLCADLHVHAARSADSGVPDRIRVAAQLTAGIEVIGLSDHNVNGDLSEAIAALHAAERIVSIPSNELTADSFHLGVYPVVVEPEEPRGGGPSKEEIEAMDLTTTLQWARALPRAPMIQVNHPRFRYAALFDSYAWNGLDWPPPFSVELDAIEVLSGHTAFNEVGDRRIDESVRDIYTFWNHAVRVTAVGNSDTHHLNGVLDGLARNYVRVDDPRLAPFDEDGFVSALRNQNVVITSGPWIDLEVSSTVDDWSTVGPGQAVRARDQSVHVDIDVRQAAFVNAERVKVVVGGAVVRRFPLPSGDRALRIVEDIEVGSADTWLAVEVSGDEPLPVEMTGTYHLENGRRGVPPFALTNPVFIDVDGDDWIHIGGGAFAVAPHGVPPR